MEPKKTWTVHLAVPMVAWGSIEVEAKDEEEARTKAIDFAMSNEEGGVEYEYGDLDTRDAEITGCEENEAE